MINLSQLMIILRQKNGWKKKPRRKDGPKQQNFKEDLCLKVSLDYQFQKTLHLWLKYEQTNIILITYFVSTCLIMLEF